MSEAPSSPTSSGGPPSASLKELERTLGLPMVVAISISAMLGSGIFVLPGLAAAKTGPSVWMAYLLAGLCVIPAATCKAELATAMPTSGGTYVYLDRIFGPLVGTVAGLMLWLSMLLKSAFALLGFGTYLLVLSDVPLKPTAMILLGVITTLNLLGMKAVARAQMVVVSVTMVGLAILVAFGLSKVEPANLTPEFAEGGSGLLAATALVFVSYNGVTKIAAIAEEVKDPGKNVPRGILVSLGLVIVIYALVAFTLVGVVPYHQLGEDLHPIHVLAEAVGGRWAGLAAAVVGVVTMTSMANAGLLAASRFPFAMSRDQLLPAQLHQLNERLRTPVAAIVVTGATMALAILLLDIERLAKLASAMVIGLFMAENLAVILYRESGVSWYKPVFRSPLYPWLQAFGVIAGLVLLVMLGPLVVAGAALVVVPGVALYLLYGRRSTGRIGVLGQRVRRSDLLRDPSKQKSELKDSISSDAAVVVALFGKERSPEMLVDIATALATNRSVEVVHLTEIPEQIPLDAVLAEDVEVKSLRRRIGAMADEKHAEVDFHSVASRDLLRTVHGITSRVRCDWLVIGWRGRAGRGLVAYNPIGWLINNLGANLALYRDAGIRYVREILVYAEPGPHDALVIGTADYLASQWGARLTLVRFVPTNADEAALQTEQDYLGQLRQMCGVKNDTLVLRGGSVVPTITSKTGAYDLLVMGAPDVTLRGMVFGTVNDRIKQEAACSVLTVKTPRVRTHEAFEHKRQSGPPAVCYLPDFVAPAAVGARLPITRKEALFQQMGQAFQDALQSVSAKQIVDALWERERTQNTSVGHGMALPHASLAAAQRALVGVFTTEEPIDYAGPDDEPVDVFFVTLCAPSERQTHLLLLSGIARLTLETNLLERLREAEDASEMLAAIRECSGELLR